MTSGNGAGEIGGEVFGRVSSIQTLGTLDGPGVRFVAFLQGCPLRCVYCHNPETWKPGEGREMSARGLVQAALKYRAYIAPPGGVTLSGGEPLLQPEFVSEVIRLCHEAGLHVAVDTSGHTGADGGGRLPEVPAESDLVLLDIKFTTEAQYRLHTGGSLQTALQTLEFLERRRVPVWVRQVIVPGLNDSEENILRLKALTSPFACVRKIELLPFSKLSLHKYERLSLQFPLRDTPQCPPETVRRLEALLSGNMD